MTTSFDKATGRREVWYGLGLFLLTVLSRIPFRSQILYHWDSINLAFGMRAFDIAANQPQPPGYILYVWLCRLVDMLFQDPQTTMVWIAIVSSGLAVVATYLLGRAMFGRPSGIVAALFLASSPLFWFYGEIALPHTLDAFLVTLSAWGLYQTMRGRHSFLYPTVALLAVVGGVRQQSLIFLIPLVVFALRGVGWRRFLSAGLLGAALCLLWAVPLFAASGGLARYLEVFSEYSSWFTATTSVFSGAGWSGMRFNVSRIVRYLLYGGAAAFIPPLFYGLARLLGHRAGVGNARWERAVFLGLWCVPVVLLYAFVHMGQQGMLFTFLPALLVVSAAALVRLSEFWSPALRTLTLVMLVLLNGSCFLFLPQHPLGEGSFKVLSRDTLHANDAYYQRRFAAIREHLPVEDTLILATNWRYVEWYLPEYELLHFDMAVEGGENLCYITEMGREIRFELLAQQDLGPDLAVGTALVIFDPELRAFNRSSARSTPLLPEGELDVMVLEAEDDFFCGSDGFGIRRE
jgi:hypothetical protein